MTLSSTFQFYFFGQLTKFCIQFFGFIAISRILTIRDIGIFSTVVVIFSFLEQLRDFGLRIASVQSKNRSHQVSSNLFWISAIIGILIAITISLLGKMISTYCNEPKLANLIYWMSLSIVFSGFQTQFHSKLSQQGAFKILVLTEILSQFVALIIGLLLALADFGYWALVTQFVLANFALLVSRVFYAKWLPSRPKLRAGTKSILFLARNLGLTQILNWISSNIDSVSISAKLGTQPLAIYSRAYSLGPAPQFNFLESIGNWVLPSVRNREGSPSKRIEFLVKFGAILNLAFFCLNIFLFLFAHNLVLSILGTKWSKSVELFQTFSIVAIFMSFSTVLKWIFILVEESKALLILHSILRSLMVLAIWEAATFSLQAVSRVFLYCTLTIWASELVLLNKLKGRELKLLTLIQIFLVFSSVLVWLVF